MRGVFLIRSLLRLIAVFSRALLRGDPWAYWTLAGVAVLAVIAWFVQFAKKPLGGGPEKAPTDEAQFTDVKNPYRDGF